ncbi:hypothetical protein NCC49_003118 [Naganishia albida]|nr:hypothetical protein NCC49_003118 [Naganishia albida]
MDTLTQHRAKYHPSAKFTCTTCQDEFTTGQKLKNHLIVNPRHMQIGLAKPSLVPVTAAPQKPRKKPKIGTADAPIKLESDSEEGSEDDMPRVEFVRASSMAPKVGFIFVGPW